MRHAVGRPVPLSHIFEGDTDAPVTPAEVTITITRGGANLPAITATALRDGTVYRFVAYGLTQDVYTVRWSGGGYEDAEPLEITGADLFKVGDLRKFDQQLTSERFGRDRILYVRDLVAEEFQTVTGRSFVPRTERTSWSTDDPLPRMDVHTVHVFDTDGPELLGTLDRIGPYTFVVGLDDGTYTVELDYGFRIPPADIRQAAMLRARSLLFEDRGGIPDRATSFQPEGGGTFILSTAGRRGATTGIPDVDAVLERYTFKMLESIGGFW